MTTDERAGAVPARPEAELPPDVAAVALSRGLGPQVTAIASTGGGRGKVVGLGLAVAAGSFGLLWLLMSVGSVPRGLAIIAFVTLTAVMLVSLAAALHTLVRGSFSYHLFAGGFVHRRRGRVRLAAGWSELAEVRAVPGKGAVYAGSIQRYDVVPRSGRRVSVPAVPTALTGQRDEFAEQLLGLVRQHGIPVR